MACILDAMTMLRAQTNARLGHIIQGGPHHLLGDHLRAATRTPTKVLRPTLVR